MNTPNTSISEDDGHSSSISTKFPLIEALLNLCHSNDSKICIQAHQCLMQITNLKEPRSSEAMSKHTLLAHYIASRLSTSAEAIPEDTEPAFIEQGTFSVQSEETTSISSDEENLPEDDFDGKKELMEFLK